MFVRLAASHRLRHALSGLAMASALALALGALPAGAQAAQADSGAVTLDISQPAANNGIAEGPVGANVAVQGQATAGDAITFGIATRSDGCASGFQQLNGVTATAAGDGTFSASFAWPQIAATVGQRYYVCAQDTTASAMGSSQSLFQVDSASAPSITVQQVIDPTAPTPGAGTPTPEPPNPPDGTFYAGGYIEVKGQNFTPGGTQIQIIVTPSQLTPNNATTPPLQIVKGVAVTSHNGSFNVIAQLPTAQTGPFYISATSSDGTSSVLPTLVGSESVQIALAPTPTPSPTPSPTSAPPSPTASANTGGGSTSGGPGPGKIAGAIGLGLFSAIFFIIGVAMLISASGMGNTPTRPQPR